MGNYFKSNPEKRKEVIKEVFIEKPQPPIDLMELANAVAKAVTANFPQNVGGQLGILPSQDKKGFKFNNSRTMEKLADNMIVERVGKKANFDDLGNQVTTEKDQEEVKKTIDLLSGLDD